MAIGSAISGIAQAVQRSDYGGQLISGGIGQIFAGANARRQWRYRKKEMKLQQQYALEQMAKNAELSYNNWQKQFDYENEYNLPTSVMERYRQAGITPAAVLGSSGVGVNATMSGGSAPSFGNSGPSSSFTQPAAYAGDPTASALNEMNRSAIDRNDAAANRDDAEADKLRGETHSAEYRKAMDDLQLQISQKEVRSADDKHVIDSALGTIYRNNAEISDWTLGGAIDAVIASQQSTIEESKRSRALTPVYSDILNGQLALQTAQAYYYASNGAYFKELAELTQYEVLQLSQEIANQWTKKFEVTLPDGSKERWSMQDFMNQTEQNRTTASFYAPEEARGKAQQSIEWKRREIFNALVGILGQAVLARGLRGRGQTGTTTTDMGNTYENVRRYNAKGEYIGGTRVTRGQVTPGKTYTEKY